MSLVDSPPPSGTLRSGKDLRFSRRVRFVVLLSGPSQVKVTLGSTVTRGLGAGGKPEVGKAAAVESLPEIEKALASADMVFITAGKDRFFSVAKADPHCALLKAEAGEGE